ncbi:MAG: efflux RND transporter periplasmic adaptor subunit [Acidobacteria bacterium]|nr:efflux RND transporter periplasmic adaptor subunit [Acidobacteriota bacterium]
MLRGKWILISGVLLIVIAGAASVVWLRRQAPPPKAVQKQVVELPKGAEVTLTGKIQAAEVLHLEAPLDGVLEELPVKSGDEVYEGQILARIANATLQENEKETLLETERAQARISALEAELTSARLEDSRLSADLARARAENSRTERTYQRQEMLHREGATPRNSYEKAQKDYGAAKDELEHAQAMAGSAQERIQRILKEIELGKKALTEKEAAHEAAKSELAAATILSPADGLIVAIKKAEGEEVQRTMGALIDLATDLSHLQIVVDAPPAYTKRLAQGKMVSIVMAELPGNGLQAEITSIEQERFIVDFASPTPLVKPGMTAAIRFKLD